MSKIKPRKSHTREAIIVIVFVLLFSILVGRLFFLQIICYEQYSSATSDGISRETKIAASRGLITDCNGVVLADNETVERVFISPADIANDSERVLISENLSAILGVDYDYIYEKACKVKRKDETIKKNVGKEEADLVRVFINRFNLSSVHLVTSTKRYYPYNNLLSHVLGFTGTDNQGLYGVEFQYDEYLTGTDGKIVTAKNGLGQDMPYDYEQYIEAQNGYTLVLTIDYNIQAILNKYLEDCLEESGAANRVTGIVMDPETGGILAMATKPDFNCNEPYVLDEASQALLDACTYEKGSEDYLKYNTELLGLMWTNKAINDTYEPGSTFKPVTCSIALEEKLVERSTAFYCPGYHLVEGYGKVHCFKREGHGAMTFELGLQQSCNPVLMMTAERIGEDMFYDYYRDYGYTSLTGIDLPGEASGIYHSEANFNNVELAVYSFGQTFKTTAIQQITALSSLANDGKLLVPHIVKQIIDDDGNIIVDFETNVKRQVVSTETASEIVDILEKAVTNRLGSSNAGVSGYKIAAKTGTSEKRDKPDENGQYSLRVASCVSMAPADDPAVTMIVIVDEPTLSRTEGSMIAAPYNGKIMAEVLPYLGYEPSYEDGENEYKTVTIGNFGGNNVTTAQSSLKTLGLDVTVIGSGNIVKAQMPAAGTEMTVKNGRVILYTEDKTAETVTVPDVIGKTASDCSGIIKNRGLNICVTGASVRSGAISVSQYPEAGTKVPAGTVVTVEFRYQESMQ